MPKITKITQQKRSARVNIFLDEKFAFGLLKKTLIDFNLFVGKEITEKEIEKILKKDQQSRALEKSFKLLGIRPRSEKELIKKLKEKGFAEKIIQKTLKKLKELGYLNDEKFAGSWLESRKLSFKGKYAIQKELKQKGVAEEIIKKTISRYRTKDEFKIALELAKKKMRTLLSKSKTNLFPSAFLQKQKLLRFLANRGFSWETIARVLKEFF